MSSAPPARAGDGRPAGAPPAPERVSPHGHRPHLRSPGAVDAPRMTRPTVGPRTAVRRRRALRCIGLFVATLGAVVLSSCSSETVTPASSPVAYVTLGAGSANPGNVVSPVATTTGAVSYTHLTLPTKRI